MLSESDLELLDAYLDDVLTASDVQRLDMRLADEPELAAALESLRRDRAARQALFQSLTPSGPEAGRFASHVVGSMRRREWQRNVTRATRLIGGLAACLLVGFTAGWMGRGRAALGTTASPASHHSDAHLAIHSGTAIEGGQYQVALLDEHGNVVAVQKFSRAEDAEQFADDLGKYEARRQQVRQGRAVLVSDKF